MTNSAGSLVGSEKMSIQLELRRIVEAREVLSFEEAAALMRRVLAGEAADMELAALLGALAGRGETAPEIAGFATAMREAAMTLPLTSRRTGGVSRHLRDRRRFQRKLHISRPRQRWSQRRPGRRSPSMETRRSRRAAVRPTCWMRWEFPRRCRRTTRLRRCGSLVFASCWRHRIIRR